MNNADEPAYPIEAHGINTGDGLKFHEISEGLTKRERFAMAAMQGICANSNPSIQSNVERNAGRAVAQADALLKELDK